MLKEQFAKLLKVKSIITILITLVFSYLSIIGVINEENFMSIFKLIIVFYFGSQVGKREAQEQIQDKEKSEAND